MYLPVLIMPNDLSNRFDFILSGNCKTTKVIPPKCSDKNTKGVHSILHHIINIMPNDVLSENFPQTFGPRLKFTV